MRVEELSLCERLVLCGRAEEACIHRLRGILQRVDPVDRLLVRLLEELIGGEEKHAEIIRRFQETTASPLVWRMDVPLMERLLGHSFPALSEGLGTGPVDRRAVVCFVESLEKESSRFYQRMSNCAPDQASRGLFARMAIGEESHLDDLRQALPPSNF